MSARLEHEYENELAAIRHMAKDFARGASGGRWPSDIERGDGPVAGSHVERLIEAFAFLTARLQVKLKDEFPELVDACWGCSIPIIWPQFRRWRSLNCTSTRRRPA